MGLHEYRIKAIWIFSELPCRQGYSINRRDYRLQEIATFQHGNRRHIFTVKKKDIKEEQCNRNFLTHSIDVCLPSSAHEFLERSHLPCGRVNGNNFALNNAGFGFDVLAYKFNHVGILRGDFLLPSREEHHLVTVFMNLNTLTIVFVLNESFSPDFLKYLRCV